MIERAETGPMQFGEDWKGVFIRGDNAIFYLQGLQISSQLQEVKNNLFLFSTIESLTGLRESCQQHNGLECQQLKDIKECVEENRVKG